MSTNPVITRIEQILGKHIGDLTDAEITNHIASLRSIRGARKLKTLEDTGLSKAASVKPRKRPHKHVCIADGCNTEWPCPIGPGCIESKQFGLCPDHNNNEPYPSDRIRSVTESDPSK